MAHSANRTNFLAPRASLRDRISKTQSAWGSTKAACQLPGVVADKQCTCLASKLMRERYPPIPPVFARASARQANFNCGENEIQASLINSASVGATPTPATKNIREVIRLPVCKSAVAKILLEVTNWSIASTSHHFGHVAQSAERPVVCGKGPCGRPPGASPFGSAIFIGV